MTVARRHAKPASLQFYPVPPEVEALPLNRQYSYSEEFEIHRLPGRNDPKTEVRLLSLSLSIYVYECIRLTLSVLFTFACVCICVTVRPSA